MGEGGDHPIDDGHAVWPHDHQVRRRPAVPAVVQVCPTYHDACVRLQSPRVSHIRLFASPGVTHSRAVAEAVARSPGGLSTKGAIAQSGEIWETARNDRLTRPTTGRMYLSTPGSTCTHAAGGYQLVRVHRSRSAHSHTHVHVWSLSLLCQVHRTAAPQIRARPRPVTLW